MVDVAMGQHHPFHLFGPETQPFDLGHHLVLIGIERRIDQHQSLAGIDQVDVLLAVPRPDRPDPLGHGPRRPGQLELACGIFAPGLLGSCLPLLPGLAGSQCAPGGIVGDGIDRRDDPLPPGGCQHDRRIGSGPLDPRALPHAPAKGRDECGQEKRRKSAPHRPTPAALRASAWRCESSAMS